MRSWVVSGGGATVSGVLASSTGSSIACRLTTRAMMLLSADPAAASTFLACPAAGARLRRTAALSAARRAALSGPILREADRRRCPARAGRRALQLLSHPGGRALEETLLLRRSPFFRGVLVDRAFSDHRQLA